MGNIHSPMIWKTGKLSNIAPAISWIRFFQRPKLWNHQNIPEVKDAKKVASDHFRIGFEPSKSSISERCHKDCLSSLQNRCIHLWNLSTVNTGKVEVQSATKGSWFSVANLNPVRCRISCLLATKQFPPNLRDHWVWTSFLPPKISFYQASLEKTIRIWPEITCLGILENHFGNPETRKLQTKIMRARPGAWCAFKGGGSPQL